MNEFAFRVGEFDLLSRSLARIGPTIAAVCDGIEGRLRSRRRRHIVGFIGLRRRRCVGVRFCVRAALLPTAAPPPQGVCVRVSATRIPLSQRLSLCCWRGHLCFSLIARDWLTLWLFLGVGLADFAVLCAAAHVSMKKLFTISDRFHGGGPVLFAWQPDGNFLATAGTNGAQRCGKLWGAGLVAMLTLRVQSPTCCYSQGSCTFSTAMASKSTSWGLITRGGSFSLTGMWTARCGWLRSLALGRSCSRWRAGPASCRDRFWRSCKKAAVTCHCGCWPLAKS